MVTGNKISLVPVNEGQRSGIHLTVFVFFLSICLFFSNASLAEEGNPEEMLQKIEESAQKIQGLIEAYKKAEVDFVKTEVISIRDSEGNPHDCDVAIFYDNGKQARFRTSGGSFEGNFNHGSEAPTEAWSLRLSGCSCRPIKTNHRSKWLGVVKEFEKVKQVIRDEIEGMAEDKAKEYAEKGFNKLMEKLGMASSAAPFLKGLTFGAEMGAPIGNYITEEINKILDSFTKKNKDAARDMDYSPLYPSVGHVSPRGRWGNYFGDNPQLENTWEITVRCGGNDIEPSEASWIKVDDLVARYNREAGITTGPPSGDDAEAKRKERERQQEEARLERERQEEQARRDRERREAERREKERREQQKREYEERQRQLRQKAREIAESCKICDPIRKDISEYQNLIEKINQSLPDLQAGVDSAQQEADKAARAEEQAREKLDNFRNPESSVTDTETGRTVTSTDLEVRQQAAIEAMERYNAGEATAEETSQDWSKLNDPDVIKKLKEKAEQRLESELQAAREAKEKADNRLSKAKQALSAAKQRLDQYKKRLEELKQKLEECIKQCKANAMEIARRWIQDVEDLMGYSRGRTKVEVLDVKPVRGNNPYDRQDPLTEGRDSQASSATSVTTSGTAVETIQVINNIPVTRLTLAGPDACPQQHFHGNANDCNGVFKTDPAPLVCGHGTISDVITIPVTSCPDL